VPRAKAVGDNLSVYFAQARVGLKFSPIEDAMMGTWLMPLDLRHVSHRRFWTCAPFWLLHFIILTTILTKPTCR